jgi:hypothetical protein
MELTLDCHYRADYLVGDDSANLKLTFLDVGDDRVIGHVQVFVPQADLLLRVPCEYSTSDIADFVRDLEQVHATLSGTATLRTSTGALNFSALDRGRIAVEFTQDGVRDIPNLITLFDFTLNARVGGLRTDQSYLPGMVASLSALLHSIPPPYW